MIPGSAGCYHTVLLRSDGTAVACGENSVGQCDFPELNGNHLYVQAAVGERHTVLLRSDGKVITCGANNNGQCDVPEASAHTSYIRVAAGDYHTVLLQNDGKLAVSKSCLRLGNAELFEHAAMDDACDEGRASEWQIPYPKEGITYKHVSAGDYHTVLLRSDGLVAAYGCNSNAQCNIPVLADGLSYIQVAAGSHHTVLLRSDGVVVTCGDNDSGQCDVPSLSESLTYTQVAAGEDHTVLLRSDGLVEAFGNNDREQCNIPELADDTKYAQIITGSFHTVLFRSDGSATACGYNNARQCDIPELDQDLSYALHTPCRHYVLQASYRAGSMIFVALDGTTRCSFAFTPSDHLSSVLASLRAEITSSQTSVDAVLPSGALLSSICLKFPDAKIDAHFPSVGVERKAKHSRVS